MEEVIDHLEQRIKRLVDEFDQLKLSHLHVDQSHALLVREKERLIDRQQQAITQIQTLITRLKTHE
jgi:uncharacterized protein (TIGR02449 family)